MNSSVDVLLQRRGRGGTRLALLAGVLALAGCAAPERPAPALRPPSAPASEVQSFVESFVRKVVVSDHEAAFAALDMHTLVYHGRPQWELYRLLSPSDQERYRRDFVEGVYAFLFRDLPPAKASWSVAAPDPGNPVVEVTGRPGKLLRLVVQPTAAGLKIVAIARP